MGRLKRLFLVSLGIAWEWLFIPLGAIYASLYLHKRLPYFLLPTPVDPWLSTAFIGLGIFWTVGAYFELTIRGKGTILPFFNPTRKLVTSGVYRYCRNPMYLGYILLFVGFSIYTHSLIILILSLTGITLFFLFYIKPREEKALLKRFGKEYLQYHKQTPILIPRTIFPGKSGGTRRFFLFHLALVVLSGSFGISQTLALTVSRQEGLIAKTERALQSIPELPEIKKDQRILVLAPHPDDEVLGTCGLIQRALAAGAQVKIVFLTNGDHNQMAFKMETKRIVLPPSTYIALGEQRREESIKAAAFLGLPQTNLIFLGYPDSGTLKIWQERWKDAEPFCNRLTRARAVPYRDNLSFGAAYKGESILNDLVKILEGYHPTTIFVTAPSDTNVDHQAAFCFLQAALLQAHLKEPEVKVWLYLIHFGAWPKPYHFHPELPLLPPKRLLNSELAWYKLTLDPEETRKKYETILLLKSILKGRAYLWTAFARRNELFAATGVLKVEIASSPAGPDWSKEPLISNIGISEVENNQEPTVGLKGISYQESGDTFFVDITLAKTLSLKIKNGISLYLFGFRKDTLFGEMPKIRITLQPFSHLSVYDGMRKIKNPQVKLVPREKGLSFLVPLNLLGQPEMLFASARVHRGETSLDATSWHLLKMAQKETSGR